MYRYEDRDCGETHDCETLKEALEAANENLIYYRKDASDSYEWSTSVESVLIGRVECDGSVTPLYCATYVGTDEEGYDVQMLPVPEEVVLEALAI
jgi:hypothetical protein